MNIRTIRHYRAKQRRNTAIFISLVGHALLIIVVALWLLKPFVEIEEDSITVDFVSPPSRTSIPKKKVSPAEQHNTETPAFTGNASTQRSLVNISPTSQTTAQPREEPPVDSTLADLSLEVETIPKPNSPEVDRDSETSGRSTGREINRRDNGSGPGLSNFSKSEGNGQDAFSDGVLDIVGTGGDDTQDGPGSWIDEENGVVRGHISLLRLKHDMSDWWQDPTAIPSLIKWLREHRPTITADMKFAGGALPLTDKNIMDAPLLIMTGHDQAMSVSYKRLAEHNLQTPGFSDAERAALRKYILDYNGMLFFDYCGNGGNEKSFATLVETELRLTFPEYPLTTLNIQHEIFQCYFKLERTPVGGSWFWGTGYKGGNNKWRYIKGISVQGRFGKDRLAVVFCPLDYLCSMETAEVDSRAPLSARRSSDVYRFMTNMFVYQMRQKSDSK